MRKELCVESFSYCSCNREDNYKKEIIKSKLLNYSCIKRACIKTIYTTNIHDTLKLVNNNTTVHRMFNCKVIHGFVLVLCILKEGFTTHQYTKTISSTLPALSTTRQSFRTLVKRRFCACKPTFSFPIACTTILNDKMDYIPLTQYSSLFNISIHSKASDRERQILRRTNQSTHEYGNYYKLRNY